MDNRIKVGIRVRPMMSTEIENGSQSVLHVEDDRLVTVNIPGRKNTFEYDWSFDKTSTQRQVYQSMCKPLIENIFEGFNATFFAYGQTGSGKTHTMGTTELTDGVIPSALNDIFQRREELIQENAKVEIELSYIEIYMEECYDLLSKTGERTKLDLRETVSGDTNLDGVQSWPVYNIETAAKYLSDASKVRATGSTNMNSQSSRSHAICTLTVRVIYEDRSVVSKLHLVDLAGSERAKKTGATGETLQEGISINKGLLALGNVVAALVLRAKNAALNSASANTAVNVQDKENIQNGNNENTFITTGKSASTVAPIHTHIPYRESKLTRLLKDALGGNGMTVLLTCISPAESNVDETLNALRFASRVTSIVNKAKVNLDTNTDNMSLLKEVNYLRKQLQDLQTKHDVVLKQSTALTSKQQPASTQLVVKTVEASDATAAMLTVAMKLSASLKAVLILCLEEGSYIDDCEVQSMQSEIDFVYSLLNFAKPVDEKKSTKKSKSTPLVIDAPKESAVSVPTGGAIPEMWSLENIMSMDLTDKALLDSMMTGFADPFAPPTGSNSGDKSAVSTNDGGDALDSLLLGGMGEFAPPIMRVIEDIRHLEKMLKKKLTTAQERERRSASDNHTKKRDRDSFNSTHSSEQQGGEDSDCEADEANDQYNDSRRCSRDSANSEYFEEDEDCAFIENNMEFFEQQQQEMSGTSSSSTVPQQQQQQEPSIQERRAMQDVKKKEDDMLKLTSQTAKYQRTINDLNAEIHALQQDQQKLQMRVQKAATASKQPLGNHNSNKESFEEIKIKRELQEKTRLLDEKVKNLKAKESELQKLSIQKTNLAKEVDGMNRTILDYKQKRIEMMKKMKSNSVTFQSEKLKLKQNESSILKRENETKQNLLRLEHTLTNKEKVFRQQLDSKEREKGQLKELLLKQQNAKQMRDNKYVKSAAITTTNAAGETVTVHSTAASASNITSNNNNKIRDEPLTKSRTHELSTWLDSEVNNHTLLSESAEDVANEIQLRGKAVRELHALRTEKKELLCAAASENTQQTLLEMDSKMHALEDSVRSRTLAIATLQATQQQVALVNTATTKTGSRFNKLHSATESKYVNDLLFIQLSKSKTHERLLERKVAKLQDQLLKFHSQQMVDEHTATVQKKSAPPVSKMMKPSGVSSGGLNKATAAFSAKTTGSGKTHSFLQKKTSFTGGLLKTSGQKTVKMNKNADNDGEEKDEQSDSDNDEDAVSSAGEMDETFHMSDSELISALNDSDDEDEQLARGRKRGGAGGVKRGGAGRVRMSGDSVDSQQQASGHKKGRGKRLSESSTDQSDDEHHALHKLKHKKQKRVVDSFGSSNDGSFHAEENDSEEEDEEVRAVSVKETKKRKAPAAHKRGKRLSVQDVVIPDGLEMSLEGRLLTSYTVKDLKGFLSARGLMVSGVKDELIRRLTAYMLTHPSESTESHSVPYSPAHHTAVTVTTDSPVFSSTPHVNRHHHQQQHRLSTSSEMSEMSAVEYNDVDRSMYMADSLGGGIENDDDDDDDEGDERRVSFDSDSSLVVDNNLEKDDEDDNYNIVEEKEAVVEVKKRKLFDSQQQSLHAVRFDDDGDDEEEE